MPSSVVVVETRHDSGVQRAYRFVVPVAGERAFTRFSMGYDAFFTGRLRRPCITNIRQFTAYDEVTLSTDHWINSLLGDLIQCDSFDGFLSLIGYSRSRRRYARKQGEFPHHVLDYQHRFRLDQSMALLKSPSIKERRHAFVEAQSAQHMARIDAMTPEMRSLIDEYGLTVVQSLIDHGVIKPDSIRQIIETIRGEIVHVERRPELRQISQSM